MFFAAKNWYCSTACATSGGQAPDGIHDYARALTWYGLLDACHRDLIREADGLGMMAMWRVNMLRFWGGNHLKYLKVGHRLLAGIIYILLL